MMFAYFKCAFHRIAYPEIWHHYFPIETSILHHNGGTSWHDDRYFNIVLYFALLDVTFPCLSVLYILYLYILHRCLLAMLILIMILCVCYICISSCDNITTLIVVDLLKVGEVLPLVNIIETDTKMIQIILDYGGTSTNAEIKVVLLRLSW